MDLSFPLPHTMHTSWLRWKAAPPAGKIQATRARCGLVGAAAAQDGGKADRRRGRGGGVLSRFWDHLSRLVEMQLSELLDPRDEEVWVRPRARESAF